MKPMQETGNSAPLVSILLGYKILSTLSLSTLKAVNTKRRPLKNPLKVSTFP